MFEIAETSVPMSVSVLQATVCVITDMDPWPSPYKLKVVGIVVVPPGQVMSVAPFVMAVKSVVKNVLAMAICSFDDFCSAMLSAF